MLQGTGRKNVGMGEKGVRNASCTQKQVKNGSHINASVEIREEQKLERTQWVNSDGT